MHVCMLMYLMFVKYVFPKDGLSDTTLSPAGHWELQMREHRVFVLPISHKWPLLGLPCELKHSLSHEQGDQAAPLKQICSKESVNSELLHPFVPLTPWVLSHTAPSNKAPTRHRPCPSNSNSRHRAPQPCIKQPVPANYIVTANGLYRPNFWLILPTSLNTTTKQLPSYFLRYQQFNFLLISEQ